MKNAKKLKIIALSLLALATSSAWAGLGSLQVRSSLGEPFSGSIVVNGDEAKALLHGAPSVSGVALQTSVVQQGHNAVVNLRSTEPIRDPVLSFNLRVGNQTRQYAALLDPPAYKVGEAKRDGRRSDAAARVRESSDGQGALERRDGGYVYRVGDQENLMAVARRVRPEGLTVAQTMHALVMANPQAFRDRNPDFLYRGALLKIPAKARMYELAKTRPKPAESRKTLPHVVKKDTVQPDTVTENNEVPAPAETMAVQRPATDNMEAAAASAVMNPEVQPAASEVASVPVAETASAVPASAAVASEQKPVVPQPVVNAPEPQPQEDFWQSWGKYILLGGGAAAILLLALFIWLRRRNSNKYEDFDDGDDDSIVILNGNETEPADASSDALVSGQSDTVPEQHAAAGSSTDADEEDWSWLGEADVSQDISATDAETQPLSSGFAQEKPAVPEEVQQPVQAKADDEWLNFDFDKMAAEMPEQQPLSGNANAADSHSAGSSEDLTEEDLSWLVEDHDDSAGQTHAEFTAPQDSVDDLEWIVEDKSGLHQAEPEAETSAQAVSAKDQTDDKSDSISALNWDELAETDDSFFTAEDSTPAAAATLSVAADKVTAEQHHEPVQTTPVSDFAEADHSMEIDWDALGLDDGIDQQAAAKSDTVADIAPATAAESQFSASSSADDVPDLEFKVEDNAATMPDATSPFATGKVDYADEGSSDAVSTIDKPLSDAEMAVPLQAKLELAKMYLEIDDAVTARQTLRELVDEANGQILEDAQKLLQQLGG